MPGLEDEATMKVDRSNNVEEPVTQTRIAPKTGYAVVRSVES